MNFYYYFLKEFNDATTDDSDDDYDDFEKSKSALMNDSATVSNEGSNAALPSVDTTKYPMQRGSILMLLMQKKRTNTIKNKEFKSKMDTIINKAHEHQMSNKDLKDKQVNDDKKQINQQNQKNSNTSETQLDRSKSSSLPHLLNDEVFVDTNADTANNAKLKSEVSVVDSGTKSRKSKRLRRSHSTYTKSETQQSDLSGTTPNRNEKKFWTVRVKNPSRVWASNLSLNNGKENEIQSLGRPRLGTTARKARDKKAKEYKKQQRR